MSTYAAMTADLVIQTPNAETRQLVLLLHGVGADASTLVPLGRRVAQSLPHACVVSLQAPYPCDMGRGRQWFSVSGVTEANRPARVAEALPAMSEQIHRWQAQTGLNAAQTTLIGFSQGAILSLEACSHTAELAQTVVAIGGRFAVLPSTVPPSVRFHLIHGTADPVIAVSNAEQGAERLSSLGRGVTLDRFEGVGHFVSAEMADRIVERLAQV